MWAYGVLEFATQCEKWSYLILNKEHKRFVQSYFYQAVMACNNTKVQESDMTHNFLNLNTACNVVKKNSQKVLNNHIRHKRKCTQNWMTCMLWLKCTLTMYVMFLRHEMCAQMRWWQLRRCPTVANSLMRWDKIVCIYAMVQTLAINISREAFYYESFTIYSLCLGSWSYHMATGFLNSRFSWLEQCREHR